MNDIRACVSLCVSVWKMLNEEKRQLFVPNNRTIFGKQNPWQRLFCSRKSKRDAANSQRDSAFAFDIQKLLQLRQVRAMQRERERKRGSAGASQKSEMQDLASVEHIIMLHFSPRLTWDSTLIQGTGSSLRSQRSNTISHSKRTLCRHTLLEWFPFQGHFKIDTCMYIFLWYFQENATRDYEKCQYPKVE